MRGRDREKFIMSHRRVLSRLYSGMLAIGPLRRAAASTFQALTVEMRPLRHHIGTAMPSLADSVHPNSV
jgi:hypothetical protein